MKQDLTAIEVTEALIQVKQNAKTLTELLAPSNPDPTKVHGYARAIAMNALLIAEWAKMQ